MKKIDFEINKRNVRVNTWGDLNSTPIIFLHGLGGTGLSCIEIANHLENDFFIVSPDLPGHGHTESFDSAKEYEMPNLLIWLEKVISKFVVGKYRIIAHSWGADIALHHYKKTSKSVSSLILLDGGYHDKDAKNKQFKTNVQDEIDYCINDFDNYIFDSYDEAVNTELSNYSRPSLSLTIATKDLIVSRENKYYWHCKGSTARGVILSLYKHPTKGTYQSIDNNVFLLHCDYSNSGEWNDLRRTLINYMKKESNIKTSMISDSGHMIHWDKPKEVINNILKIYENI